MEDLVDFEVVETISVIDFEPLFEFLMPYFSVLFFLFGIVIALLIVILFSKGWQSNVR